MSYTKEIKKELSSINFNDKSTDLAYLATLYALLSEEKNGIIRIKTENLTVARKILVLSKKYLLFEPVMEVKPTKVGAKNIVIILIDNKNHIDIIKEKLYMYSDIADIFQSRISDELLINNDCNIACLVAAFLVNGFIAAPKKSYHFEISTNKIQVFDDICNIFLEQGFNIKITGRQNKNVLYMKNKDDIAKFLNLISANRSLVKFLDTKVEKELKNDINRQLNCESSNENKVISASVIQTNAINTIIASNKFDELSDILKDTANLRLAYPTMPLSELVIMSDNKITKSGLNHRLKKLIEIADKLATLPN